MKKIILGFLSILFAGLASFAQPVSDMAVIPMGITIQSVMRLNITKGGNIEFVFKSATDVAAGIPVGAAFTANYETAGTITASQNWDLTLRVDETDFLADNGGGTDLVLGVVSLETACADALAAGATILAANTPLAQNLIPIDDNGADNYGDAIAFSIRWACGNTVLGGTTVAGAAAGRYSANIILNLVPVP